MKIKGKQAARKETRYNTIDYYKIDIKAILGKDCQCDKFQEIIEGNEKMNYLDS